MIRTFLLFFILLLTADRINAQTFGTIHLDFTSEDENRLVKEDDSFKYYQATGDTSRLVSISDDTPPYYRLYSKDHKVMSEGTFIIENEKNVQDGRWTRYFDNGKVRLTGYFNHGMPVGTWQEYYNTGTLKQLYNYALITQEWNGVSTCISGSYQEYYPDGKLKVNGYYSASLINVSDTQELTDPVTNNNVIKVSQRVKFKPVKAGHWEYFTESGDVEKKEDL
jgi:antitoxin component YwqK of YwqJK toxin-antitoxin module